MSLSSERNTVQNPLVKYATLESWEYLTPEKSLLLRKGESGLLYKNVLMKKLIEFNPNFIDQDSANSIVNQIETVSNNIEGNAQILYWLRGQKSVFDSKQNRQRNVKVVDFKRPEKNIFHVTDEWQYTNGQKSKRADIMFLINGIPVGIVETKNAKKTQAIEEAWTQIKEYHKEVPEMLTMPQVFNITHLIDFYYGATWSLNRKNIFNWKDEEKGNFEKKVRNFFNTSRFLQMLRDWILFFIKEDELQKTILRQHQARAVDKIVNRCLDKKKKTGLIWHTQGSGKTFTMITSAKQILENDEHYEKPTVILMMDRNELEGQLAGWVDRILGEMKSHNIAIEHATSKVKLQKLLKSDFRGLIISMIHKFAGMPKDLNTRSNIFVLLDEAHRSVGGDLGTYLISALPKATLIGFTGTPIDKTAYGKGTFKIFGKEDEKGYLDKYSISESIEDKTTLPLKYTLAPNEVRVKSELLEKEFFSLMESEGISDIDELNKILDKAVNIKTFLKSPDRIRQVAEFIARHYRENVEPMGYKAFLVGVDREACALYKQALDKFLPEDYSVPIYSAAQHDSERYPLVYKYQIDAAQEKNYRKIFIKPDSKPKIFIVTDKLLTGFDAPVLYAMYLDKPMRDHVLLQAIARVNRPYEISSDTRKPCGLVVDFVGIFEKLEKALSFDSDVVNSVIENIDLIMDRFKNAMENEMAKYIDLAKGPVDDKTIEKAIDYFADQNKREKFYNQFKELESFYEILSPSPGLRDYLESFKALSQLFRIIRNAYKKKTVFYDELSKKTAHLVKEQVESYGPQNTLQEVEINEKTLKALKDKGSSDHSKVINLVNSIRKKIDDDGEDSPYLFAIGERANLIMEMYDDRQCSTKEALQDIENLINEIVKSQKEQEQSGFDINTFSIYWTLNKAGIQQAKDQAPLINDIFKRFSNFKDNPEELRQLKAELYKILLNLTDKDKMLILVQDLISINRKTK